MIVNKNQTKNKQILIILWRSFQLAQYGIDLLFGLGEVLGGSEVFLGLPFSVSNKFIGEPPFLVHFPPQLPNQPNKRPTKVHQSFFLILLHFQRCLVFLPIKEGIVLTIRGVDGAGLLFKEAYGDGGTRLTDEVEGESQAGEHEVDVGFGVGFGLSFDPEMDPVKGNVKS